MNKPPLGIMPRQMWIEQRINDLKSTIARYMEQGLPIPTEWLHEYNDLVRGEKA